MCYTQNEFMDNLPQVTPAYSKEKKPFPKKIVFLLVLLLLLCAGGVIGVRYFTAAKLSKNILSPSTSPTVTQAPSPTQAATPTVSTTVTSSVVSPTKAAGKTTPTSATSRSSTTVSILNGSGVAGAASKVSATLQGLGYQIGTVGNADTYDYTDVTIEVKKSKASLLPQLKKDLSSYTIGSSSATLKESNAADAVVIVGKWERIFLKS